VRGFITLILYENNVFLVKSFVDSGNNGLDGVRIALAAPFACSTNLR
jgi:hypothetical protein